MLQANILGLLYMSLAIGFTLDLVEGWNLFSFPIIPESTTLTFLLRDIVGSYDRVYYFDAANQKWLTYNPNRQVFDPQNTLFSLDVGRAYWIRMAEARSLEIRGYESPYYTVPLYAGWNYLGYPSTTIVPASEALQPITDSLNVLYEYVPIENRYLVYEPHGSFNTLTQVTPGRGYAVEMLRNDNLVVQ